MTHLLKVLNSFTYQTKEIDVAQTELRRLLPHPPQAKKDRYKLGSVYTLKEIHYQFISPHILSSQR